MLCKVTLGVLKGASKLNVLLLFIIIITKKKKHTEKSADIPTLNTLSGYIGLQPFILPCSHDKTHDW